jgi:uncharacterized damage-inducible protein DinB
MTGHTTELDRIRGQLRRAILGDAWHGPSFTESMAGLDPAGAWSRVSPHSHNTVELVLHIAAWLEIVRERFAGQVVRPAPAEDWPPTGAASAESWQSCVARLLQAHADLDAALAAATDARLAETVPGQEITMYQMLHGAVQHSIYHAGQIVLIRRVLGGHARREDGA